MIELRKRIILQDKDGKITYDSGDTPSHSFVKLFLGMMQVIWGNVIAPTPTIKSTIGTNYTYVSDAVWTQADIPFSIDNDLDNSDWGILLGDDDSTPEANDNFRLDSVIAAGAGVGQVNYGVTTWDAAVTVDGLECSWGFTRSMTNNSGGNVVVKEIGVYVRFFTGPVLYGLILRDLLVPYITIPDGETMTVKYTLVTSA